MADTFIIPYMTPGGNLARLLDSRVACDKKPLLRSCAFQYRPPPAGARYQPLSLLVGSRTNLWADWRASRGAGNLLVGFSRTIVPSFMSVSILCGTMPGLFRRPLGRFGTPPRHRLRPDGRPGPARRHR
jgi:hypothetical protein